MNRRNLFSLAAAVPLTPLAAVPVTATTRNLDLAIEDAIANAATPKVALMPIRMKATSLPHPIDLLRQTFESIPGYEIDEAKLKELHDYADEPASPSLDGPPERLDLE